MEKLEKFLTRALHALIAVCLLCMTMFVFTNVVLRYVFNSGITWAEEASRYLFVWLIFLGAIIGLRENAHLGVEVFIKKLPPQGRKLISIFNYLVIMTVMALVVHGAFKVTALTWTQSSASIGMPLSFVYLSGLLASASMVVICLNKIYKLCTNKDPSGNTAAPASSDGGEKS